MSKKNRRQGYLAGLQDLGVPVPKCCICGKPAMTNYPEESTQDEDLNSCGSPQCELQMQAAMDFHEECGHR